MTNESQLVGIQVEDDQNIRELREQLAPIAPVAPVEEKNIWAEARSLMRDILVACAIATIIVFFLVRPVRVEGDSMKPKLHNLDRIFVNQMIYPVREWMGDKQPIKRGDIVVLYFPNDPSKSYIKRVVGLPGEKVTYENGKLYINGVMQNEPYLPPDASRDTSDRSVEREVESHHYFVMGDNRSYSSDSRDWGLVPEKYIYGKAMFRYYSPENWFANVGGLQ